MNTTTFRNTTTRIKEWFQSRRDARASALGDHYISIVRLNQMGLVRVNGTGVSIKEIRTNIDSRVRVWLQVLIPHGTYFVAAGSHQNMVTREEYRFTLSPLGTDFLRIAASCINANKKIPGDQHRFRGVASASENLTKFLKAAEEEDAMVVQAGVWAITDRYTGTQVMQRLKVDLTRAYREFPGLENTLRFTSSLSSSFPDIGSAFSKEDISRAAAILDKLHIFHYLKQ